MAAAGMRMGKKCCCCNDIYKANFLELARVTGDTAKSIHELTAAVGEEPDVATKFAFDHVHENVYYIVGIGLQNQIRRRNKNLNNPQVILTCPSGRSISGIAGLAVHPGSQRIYYGCNESPSGERFMRRCDYDGTNDVEILHHPDNSAAGGAQSRIIAVSRDDAYVFYYMAYGPPSTKKPEIRRCDSDGSNDMQIWEAATANDTLHQSLDIDNTNQKVIFAHDYRSGGSNRGSKLMRCDFDGSNVQELLDAPPGSTTGGHWWISGANWSHKLERIIYWHGQYFGSVGVDEDDDTGGLYSMAADGTDIQPLVVPANEKWHPYVDEDVNQLELGCGFETTGPETLA
ncbi:hypothetical protein [Anatilimnocola floriformis]|uniref:hypothetical protein n=1 Tax=Anatilimnocola floriformis TaxID=2948575 RepID=UPI0020C1C34F|nr:hypothetical protein [Anatilimnocola floriformis]